MKDTSRSYGQALVEIALGLPLVLFLIIGVLELGRAFFTKIALTNAAREGANYYVYHRDDLAIGFYKTKEHVQKEVANSGVNINIDQITVQCLDVTINDITGEIISEVDDPSCSGRSTVEVTVINKHVTIFGFLIGDIDMTSDARMVLP